jgi:hypothetical protein
VPPQLLPQPAPLVPAGNAPLPPSDEESVSDVSAEVHEVPPAVNDCTPSVPTTLLTHTNTAAPPAQGSATKRSSFLGWLGVRSDAPATASQPGAVQTTVAPTAEPMVREGRLEPQPPAPEIPIVPSRRPSGYDIPAAPPAYVPEPPVTPQLPHKVPIIPEAAPTPVYPVRQDFRNPDISAPKQVLPVANEEPTTKGRQEVKPSTPSIDDLITLGFAENADICKAFAIKVQQLCSDHDNQMMMLQHLRAQLAANKADITKSGLYVHELESEQQRMAQIEAFEEADEIGNRMEVLRAEVQAKTAQSAEILSKETELIVSMATHRAKVCSLVEEFTLLLAQLKHKQEADAERLKAEREKEFGSVEERLTAEEERVTTEMKHLKREEEVVIEESKTIESAIASQSGKLTDEKMDLDTRLLGLNSEIKQLEQQLLLKRKEAAEVTLMLDEVEDKIGDVRKKYDRQLHRIADRQAALSKALAECLKEESVFNSQRAVYERHKQQFSDVLERVQLWAAGVDAEVSNAEVVTMTLGKSQLDSLLLASTKVGGSTDDTLREAVVTADVSLARLMQSKRGLQDKQTQLEAERKAVDARIPALENEKKDHAVNKRYKEAAQASKDIKVLSTRRDEIETELSSALKSVETTDAAILEATARLNDATAALKRQDAVSVSSKYKMYLSRIAQLQRAVSGIISGRSANSDCQEFEAGLLALLRNELDELTSAAAVIKAEYSLSDDVEPTPEDIEEEPVESNTQSVDAVPSVADNAEIPAVGNAEMLCSVDADVGADANADAVDNVSIGDEEQDEVQLETARQAELRLIKDKVRALVQQRDDLCVKRDSSAESEDYEAAAEFDEQITVVTAELDEVLNSSQLTLQTALEEETN